MGERRAAFPRSARPRHARPPRACVAHPRGRSEPPSRAGRARRSGSRLSVSTPRRRQSMSLVVINAVTVPAEGSADFEAASRRGRGRSRAPRASRPSSSCASWRATATSSTSEEAFRAWMSSGHSRPLTPGTQNAGRSRRRARYGGSRYSSPSTGRAERRAGRPRGRLRACPASAHAAAPQVQVAGRARFGAVASIHQLASGFTLHPAAANCFATGAFAPLLITTYSSPLA
jgi:hypothetical protein